MNEEELKRVIGKYYKGDSTEEEEKMLAAFFTGSDIPEGYEAEQKIFGYYISCRNTSEPSPGFESRILKAIEKSDKTTPLNSIGKYMLPLLSAAAVFMIMIGYYIFFGQRNRLKDTFSDPEIAYAETRRILFGVSEQLNRGAETLAPVGKISEMTVKSFKSINKSTSLINNEIKILNHLNEDIFNNDIDSSYNNN